MNLHLALTGLFMGLAGGPHCLLMCGAACAGIASAGPAANPQRRTINLLWFQLGRLVGYSALGALAASTIQGVGWLSTQSALFRPVWTLLHAMAFLLGLVLLWRAEQPLWLQAWGQRLWQRLRPWATRHTQQGTGPLLLGCVWALMPCGLLYGALMVAALANHPAQGAAVMAAFALGSAVVLGLGPWIGLRLLRTRTPAQTGAWGVRLAGAGLVLSSGWVLWMGLVHSQAPWCITVKY